ncbi:MAG TPA: hypothetical protein VGL53_03385 [Bryobacteraceae bacterium]|jgi:hypothetical protein
MKKPVVIGIVFGIAVLVVIVWSSFNMSQVRMKACMQWEGRTNCATASGSTKEFATRAAVSTACATISGGVTGTIGCEGSKPISLEEVGNAR